MKNKYIIIEGNIGAGKSTLASALASAIEGRVQLEPAEGQNPYLPLYYKDPARYAFVMQVFLLHKRLRAHKEAQALCQGSEGVNVVADRSFWGDLCFAAVQRELGFFSEDDFSTYYALHRDMQEALLYPSAILHLTTAPAVCAERINRRLRAIKGRECEAGVSIDYLDRLDRQISAMVRGFERMCPVLRLSPLAADGTEKSTAVLVEEAVTALKAMEGTPDTFDYRAWQGVGGFISF